MQKYYLGVDLGGTKVLSALADLEGNILARRKLPTEVNKGQERVFKNIKDSISELLEETGLSAEEIVRMGVGAPGPLNIEEGIVFKAPNLDWENVNIVDILQKEFAISTRLENDANAAALGEKWFGAGQGADNVIYVTVSTGIGGGIIIDRKIYHGASDGAGEVGHFVLDPDGARCKCGNLGCFEALASGTAVARMGREAVMAGEETILSELARKDQELDAEIIARAAREGDQISLEIWERTGFYLGLGLANLLNIFNPERLILGGGVMKSADLFWEPMMKTLKDVAFESFVEAVEICRSELGDDTGVMGAIAVAMGDHLMGDKADER